MDAGLLAQAVGIPAARATRWVAPIHAAAQYAGLTTRERMAAFLAQTGHESGGFQWTREIWGPTPAQASYEGRKDLGNVRAGDGGLYRGRGLLQITGRANYRRLTERLRDMAAPDFVRYPEALEAPQWAALSAAAYWLAWNLNRFCTPGRVRFIALTRAINGGKNGYDDRLARYQRAWRVLGE